MADEARGETRGLMEETASKLVEAVVAEMVA
jgi:hypothetical protein